MNELDDFIDMIWDDRFVEAHVVLENPWKAVRRQNKDEGNILKGLINGASALELKRRGKEESALRIWSAFEKYRTLIDTVKTVHTEQYRICAKTVEAKKDELFN